MIIEVFNYYKYQSLPLSLALIASLLTKAMTPKIIATAPKHNPIINPTFGPGGPRRK